jgi:predicted dehydrogenase
VTPWRKDPGYQGGFLLDGGIHHIAGFRLVLGDDDANAITKVSAFTAQLQPHLPPIDTINSTLRTKGGVSGTVALSFGTTLDDKSYHFGFEKGKIIVENGVSKVIYNDGTSPQESSRYMGTGVKEEIKAWAQALNAGKANEKQSPKEALQDLKLLEAMIQSGEKDGAVFDLA